MRSPRARTRSTSGRPLRVLGRGRRPRAALRGAHRHAPEGRGGARPDPLHARQPRLHGRRALRRRDRRRAHRRSHADRRLRHAHAAAARRPAVHRRHRLPGLPRPGARAPWQRPRSARPVPEGGGAGSPRTWPAERGGQRARLWRHGRRARAFERAFANRVPQISMAYPGPRATSITWAAGSACAGWLPIGTRGSYLEATPARPPAGRNGVRLVFQPVPIFGERSADRR